MAQSATARIARLARGVRDLEDKRRVAEGLQLVLQSLERGGAVVSGEQATLERLQALLDQALAELALLGRTDTTPGADDHIAGLENLLGDIEWDVAARLCTTLTQKDGEQTARVTQLQNELADWRARIANLVAGLERGRVVRAPLVREEVEVVRLRALVEQAEQASHERRFGALAIPLDQLRTETDHVSTLSTGISTKERGARTFFRQADLLILRAPTEADRHHYTVLLRTASEPGTHGINVQDTSTLVKQDRDLMLDTVNQITTAVNLGLARLYSAQTPSSAAPATGSPNLVGGERAVDVSSVPETASGAARDFVTTATSGAPLVGRDVNQLVADVGDIMFRLIMPEQMQRYFEETPCSLTITTNDLELPWELMCWGSTCLCLDRPVARMPMGRVFPRRDTHPRTEGKLRFLLVHADPHGTLPAAGTEVQRIKDGLEAEWKDRITIDVLPPEAARGGRLNDALRRGTYDVIHYAGHAAFDAEESDLSGLLLHDDEVFFAQKIRRLLEGRPLVFLNACQSGRIANEAAPQTVERYLQKPAEGLASSFIYGGALGCIGALWPIYDQPAADFAVHVYRRLLEGHMIGEAMRDARNHVHQQHPTQVTWASFVLYGNPTFRLLDWPTSG
jgi:hypothetical protein